MIFVKSSELVFFSNKPMHLQTFLWV